MVTPTELKSAILELQSLLRESILETHEARAERDRLKLALQRIANHSADGHGAGGWKHWKTLAREALDEPPSAAQQQGTDIYSGIY